MKILALIILLFIGFTLNGQIYEFKLWDCRSQTKWHIKDSNLNCKVLLLETISFDTTINRTNIDSLNILFQDILSENGDEVWLNHCIDDGTNLKFIISHNGVSKKVFVGNYFDDRLNKIALIINPYLTNFKGPYFESTIDYGSRNMEWIKAEIESQNSCPEASEDYKISLLNKWCEPLK